MLLKKLRRVAVLGHSDDLQSTVHCYLKTPRKTTLLGPRTGALRELSGSVMTAATTTVV